MGEGLVEERESQKAADADAQPATPTEITQVQSIVPEAAEADAVAPAYAPPDPAAAPAPTSHAAQAPAPTGEVLELTDLDEAEK